MYDTAIACSTWASHYYPGASSVGTFDLALAPANAERMFGMGAVSLGAVYDLPEISGVMVGLGARGTINVVGADLEAAYGTRTPRGAFVYIELHLSATKWSYTLPNAETTRLLSQAGYPLFTGMQALARTIAAMVRYREARERH